MSSTNKTTNYELSQFVGTDKPAWLQDYNSDMGKIDAQMKLNADAASSASGAATAAGTAVGDITQLQTTAKTSAVVAINEVNSKANTAASTASSANVKADTALMEIGKLNLSQTGACTVTATYGGSTRTITDHNLRYAKDADENVFKLYGYIQLNDLLGATGTATITISGPALNPESEYTINSMFLGIYKYHNSAAVEFVSDLDATIKTNGEITIGIGLPYGDINSIRLISFPCLYFNKSLGD